MLRSQRKNLSEGSVPSVLLRLTLPMVWGLLCLMLFNVVDTMFVGHLGPHQLAAMSFTFPVVFLVTGTAMGMGVGASSVISRAMGKGNLEEVRLLASSSITLALLFVLVMTCVGLATLNPVFRALGASEDLLEPIRSYMIPFYLGVPFLVLPMVGNSAIRATGDTLTPSLIIIFAGFVNLILDPLLIFGLGPFPRLELQGAALATVTAYGLTCIGSFVILRYREKLLDFHFPGWPVVLAAWHRILRIAGPAIATNMLVPLATGVLTRIISSHGPFAVAAYGVGSRLESLSLCACFALSTAMAAFAGQNFGADRPDRVREGLLFGARFCFTVTLSLWALMSLFATPIAGLFTETPEIISLTRRFLWIVPSSYGALGVMLTIASSFNANDMPLHSVSIFALRLVGLMIPLGWLGGQLFGPTGVFAGIALANLLAAGFAVALIHRFLRRALAPS